MSTPLPNQAHGMSSQPPELGVDLRDIDNLMRLPNFKFTSGYILPSRFRLVSLALGAVVNLPGEKFCIGTVELVTKNLTVIFDCALDTLDENPSILKGGLDDTFWATVLEEIKERDVTLAKDDLLNPGAVELLVKTYTAAYDHAEMHSENEDLSGEPHSHLLAVVDTWYYNMMQADNEDLEDENTRLKDEKKRLENEKERLNRKMEDLDEQQEMLLAGVELLDEMGQVTRQLRRELEDTNEEIMSLRAEKARLQRSS